MATNSKILAQRFLWTEEPGGLQSIGSQRVRHDRSNLACMQGKKSTCNAADPGSIPGSGRSTGEGIGYPLQYSCLENSMDIGAWQATVCWVAKSWMQLSDFHKMHAFDIKS